MVDRKSYLLDRFFQDKLTEEENREFEEYARTDKEFRLKMIYTIKMHGWFEEFLGGKDQEEAKGAVRRVQGRERKQNRKLFFYAGSGIAAAIAIGLVLTILLRAPLSDRLYKEYFGPVEIMTFRSPGKEHEKSILLPVYLDTNLESIRAAAENPVMLEKFTDLDYVLAGYAFMQAGNMDTAKQMLEKVKKDTEQYPAAAWYLGLISLHNNQIEECISYMRQATESLAFMDEAQAILQELQEKR